MPFFAQWSAACAVGGTALPSNADGLFDITTSVFNPYPNPIPITVNVVWTGYVGYLLNGTAVVTETEAPSPTPCVLHQGSRTFMIPPGGNTLGVRTQMTIFGMNGSGGYYGGYIHVTLGGVPTAATRHTWGSLKSIYR